MYYIYFQYIGILFIRLIINKVTNIYHYEYDTISYNS